MALLMTLQPDWFLNFTTGIENDILPSPNESPCPSQKQYGKILNMDMGFFIINSLAVTIGIWLIGAKYGYKTKRDISAALSYVVMMPFILLFLGASLGMIKTPEAGHDIADNLITSVGLLISEKFPEMFISDLVGGICGALLHSKTGRRTKRKRR